MLAEQQKEINTPYGVQAESMAFAIFADHATDDYKRTLLCLTYRVIENNSDITTRTAHWILGRYYRDRSHIDWALNCLSTNIFSCVVRWVDENKNSHYKVKRHSAFREWFELQVDLNPELTKFNVHKK